MQAKALGKQLPYRLYLFVLDRPDFRVKSTENIRFLAFGASMIHSFRSSS